MDKTIIRYTDYGNTIGVMAYLNAYAYVKLNNNNNYSVLLDIFGRETAVKAVSSAFLTHRPLSLTKGNSVIEIKAEYNFQYKRMKSSLRLPKIGKIYREVIIADAKEIVYVPNGEDRDDLLFKAFDMATTIPLYDGWKKELINKLFKDDCLIKLELEGIDGDIYIYNNGSDYLYSFRFDSYAKEFLDEKYPKKKTQEEQEEAA